MLRGIELTDDSLHFHFVLPGMGFFDLVEDLLHLVFTVVWIEEKRLVVSDELS